MKMRIPPTHRGHYRDLGKGRVRKEAQRRIRFVECLVKHKIDSAKDVCFLFSWCNAELFRYTPAVVDSFGDDYEKDLYYRFLYQPRTRKEKAIFHSRVATTLSLIDLLTRIN